MPATSARPAILIASDPRVRWGATIPVAAPVLGDTERCIELPLGLEAMALDTPGRVFDAGCALLPTVNTMAPDDVPIAHVWHGTQNIACEHVIRRGTQGSYCSLDVRDLSVFASQCFDRVVCISTLEHVGFDNHQYGAAVECDPASARVAISELWRVTRGTLVITVPCHPSGRHNGRWRYVAPGAFGDGWETAYYARTPDGAGWYGGGPEPLPFTAKPTAKVQQMMGVRRRRGPA